MGVAKVVIQAKQHLAILIPCGRALVLNLLRWGGEIRSFEQLDLPPLDARAAGIKAAEMTMALALIKDMSQAWDADQFRNSFSEEIHQLVQAKAHAGDVQSVQRQQDAPAAPANAAVLDLTALLRSSLGKAGSRAPPPRPRKKYRGGGKSCKSCKSARDPDNAQAPKASVQGACKTFNIQMKRTIAVLHNLQMAFHDKNTCIFCRKMDSTICIANSNDLPKVIFRISYTPWIFQAAQ